jgi:hypothetical protein
MTYQLQREDAGGDGAVDVSDRGRRWQQHHVDGILPVVGQHLLDGVTHEPQRLIRHPQRATYVLVHATTVARLGVDGKRQAIEICVGGQIKPSVVAQPIGYLCGGRTILDSNLK